MATDRIEEPTDSAPLDARELGYLRSKLSAAAPKRSLVTGLAPVAIGLTVVIFAPELHGFWSLLGFGVLLALSIYNDQVSLREDLSAGVKLWRDGRAEAIWMRDDGESWPPSYRIRISLDMDPDCR